MKEQFDIVIGLEIHAELNTKTKCFCSCKNEFGSGQNTNCCPVCLAFPGALPVLNKEAVNKTIAAGLALGCKINDMAIFERKHYFYPDLSSGYQRSQLERPICLGGGVKLKNGKFAQLNRIHLEEDAGKLIHEQSGTYVDYNRGGTPLIEIVTEPVLNSAEETVEFLEEVRSRLIFAGVANCKMEEGGMRCDVNLSVKPAGSEKLGNRTEMKNLNSFKMVARAIEFEAQRQKDVLKSGGRIVVETRKWDDVKGTTTPMRNKEQAQDYRYFADPDIYAIEITESDVKAVKESMPALASEVKEKLLALGLTEYEAGVVSSDSSISTFFFDTLKLFNNAKTVCNWVLTNVLAKAISNRILMTAKQLADILKLVDSKKITRTNAVALLDALWNTSLDAEGQANKMGMIGGVDSAELEKLIDKLIIENPAVVADFETKADRVINFFVGQVMKNTGGKADAAKAKELISKKIQK